MPKSIQRCRISNKKDLINIAKFSPMPLTGKVLDKLNSKVKITPFEIVFSKSSKLLQLKHNYNTKDLFGKNYGYQSGINPIMKKHLIKKSDFLKKVIDYEQNDFILDIGSNDGTFINTFNGKNKYAIDPSIIIHKKNYRRNIKTFATLFESANKSLKNKKFKLITSIAMFYDLPKPVISLKKISKLLNDDGIIHIEVAYLPKLINKKHFSYDTFCQEHLEYYSLISLNKMCELANLQIIDYGFSDINGGSIWINLKKNYNLNPKIKNLILREKKNKIHLSSTYKFFFKKIFNHSKKIKKIIEKIKIKNSIYAYGASTKGNVLLHVAGLNSKNIDGIFEINKHKINKYTTVGKIKILHEKKIQKIKPDYVLILIWHFKSYVINKIKKLSKKTKVIIPFPNIRIK